VCVLCAVCVCVLCAVCVCACVSLNAGFRVSGLRFRVYGGRVYSVGFRV